MTAKGLTYEDAGVNISEADRFIAMIRERVGQAWPDSAKEINGFAGRGIIPPDKRYLSSSTDGVGTKLMLAALMEMYGGIGQDAVAMSAVDTYVNGEKPAYLLGYFATGKLNPEKHIKIIESVIQGCQLAGCKLIGGETAEMPNFFLYDWMVDLVTFVIGFPNPPDPRFPEAWCPVETGQKVYGWPSNGPASNGFSLIRKVFGLNDSPSKVRRKLSRNYVDLGNRSLAEVLLAPTPIWIKEIEKARSSGVHFPGHAHITGGGLVENPPRILPKHLKMVIDKNSWQRPPIFRLIQEKGKVPKSDMDRTFNNGVMLISIACDGGRPLEDENAFEVGTIEKRRTKDLPVVFTGEYNDSAE